jgi:hypothetical protein
MTRGAAAADRADVAVVGGGPAGLMAAIAAAEAGRRVLVLEQLDRPGAKLLASGGGRCNLTSTLPARDFLARFGRQGRFAQPALEALGPDSLRKFLDSLGVPTHSPDGLHVYPVSNSAVTVQSALWRRAKELRVAVRLGVCATGLWIEDGGLRGVETGDGRVAARSVVLACGGKGYRLLGGTGTGYDLARRGGHTIVEPVPALVPLVAREAWPRRCAGVALSPARVWIDLARQSRAGLVGDVLFTHMGVSGPAVLDLSGDVAALLRGRAEVPLRLDVSPGTSAEEWLARHGGWQAAGGQKTMAGLLDRHLPKSLAAVVCDLAGIRPDTRPARVSRAVRRTFAELLTGLPLAITGTEGWDRAMVTRGGVSLKEVDPKTLRSRRLAGLSLAGEILDLDGPSGGFNLQWAFSSGYLAGLSI